MFWVIMSFCGKSRYCASNRWSYFSKPYRNERQILQCFFDKSDMLFESSVTKCAMRSPTRTKKFDVKTSASQSRFLRGCENVLCEQELKTTWLARRRGCKEQAPLEHVLRQRTTVCVSLRFMNKIRWPKCTGERFCTLGRNNLCNFGLELWIVKLIWKPAKTNEIP